MEDTAPLFDVFDLKIILLSSTYKMSLLGHLIFCEDWCNLGLTESRQPTDFLTLFFLSLQTDNKGM